MPAADPTLVHAALEISGGFLYAVTEMVVAFGILVIAFSFRGSQQKQ